MIITLTGSNTQAIDTELKKITDEFVQSHGDSIERFDGQELTSVDSLLDAVRSISFLDPRKLVLVRSFGQSKLILERIDEIVSATADSTDLILIDPKADKRSSAVKNLKKSTDYREFGELGRAELASWLEAEASRRGGTIGRVDGSYLIDRVGTNQLILASELTKLIAYTPQISRASIDMLTDAAPQSKVFDMLDALFRRDLTRAWSLYEDQRAQGEEPQKLLAMITWQLQQIAVAVFAPRKEVSVLTAAGLSPYAAQKSLATARQITPAELKEYISRLAEIDRQTKTSADSDAAMAVFFAELAA